MKTLFNILLLIAFLCSTEDIVSQDVPNNIPLNQIQIIGSHNSYKIAIDKPLFEYILEKEASLSSLEYEHLPLTDQLNLGLRSLELDVFHDPVGGYYSNPQGLDIVKSMGAEPEPFDVEQKLLQPGLKVFHVQEIDFRSHQLLFKDALSELKKWSETHQGHTPIIITLNAKDGEIPQTRKPFPFTSEALQHIDKEIRQVFDEEELITPDKVRGAYETLEEAILTHGWPKIGEVENKFLFVLDEGERKMNAYLSLFPKLKGAALFVNQKEGNPEAAFRIVNDPIENFDYIQSLVKQGYIVRTRADANTVEARNNDYQRFEKAKQSGAQVITTDYYVPSNLFSSTFKVIFPDGSYERIKE